MIQYQWPLGLNYSPVEEGDSQHSVPDDQPVQRQNKKQLHHLSPVEHERQALNRHWGEEGEGWDGRWLRRLVSELPGFYVTEFSCLIYNLSYMSLTAIL